MSVRDISEENMLDVFRICSANKLEDRTQLKGIRMKRRWLRKMMKEYAGMSNHANKKSQEDRNTVNAELGLHVLNRAFNIVTKSNTKQQELFND